MADQFKRKIDSLVKQYTEDSILNCKTCSRTSFDVEGDISFKLSYTKPLFPEILVTDFVTKNLDCTSCNESVDPMDMIRDDLLFIALYRVFGHMNPKEIRRKLGDI
jgi:hypothetical protein